MDFAEYREILNQLKRKEVPVIKITNDKSIKAIDISEKNQRSKIL